VSQGEPLRRSTFVSLPCEIVRVCGAPTFHTFAIFPASKISPSLCNWRRQPSFKSFPLRMRYRLFTLRLGCQRKNTAKPHFLAPSPLRLLDTLFRRPRYDNVERIRDVCYSATQFLPRRPTNLTVACNPQQDTPLQKSVLHLPECES
jgi:hypothetical protein